MGIFLSYSTYIVGTIFLGRFAFHVISWVRAAKEPSAGAVSKKLSLNTIVEILLDILLFMRLFKTNKLLWAASWAFHLSLFLVILRHLRYFLYPVPEIIVSLQGPGMYAGYMLPLTLLFILFLRITGNHDRYVSVYNFFLVITLFLTGLTGLLIKIFYRADLVDVKAFVLGILSFNPGTLPESILFSVHYILFLILIPALPFHIVAAPLVTAEARRREEGMHMVLHEK